MKNEIYKDKIEKIKELVSVEYFCDKCKKEIKKNSSSEEKSFKVKFKNGYSFAEGADINIEEAYFCEECKNFIQDLLESNGVVFTNRKLEW